MRILYALLAAGNGHVSRARTIIPLLQQFAEVDIALSGTDAQVTLPVPAMYRYHGLIFYLGRRGGLDCWKTIRNIRLPTLFRDIRGFPLEDYDLLINDFEPVTARAAKRFGFPSVSLSHQASFLSRHTPRPSNVNPAAEFVLRNYAPCGQHVGFHFQRYDSFIHTPVIRREVRELSPRACGHYTVYLPAYGDAELTSLLSCIPNIRWHVFSKRSTSIVRSGNIVLRPIESSAYLESLGNASGLLCGAGFEAPAEALYLGKKLLVIPQRMQFEQQCNAVALRQMGVTTIQHLDQRTLPLVREWTRSARPLRIDYPDETRAVLQSIIQSSPTAIAYPAAA